MCFREDALAGQHIVISGGCGAIGVGVVRELVRHGARVTVNDVIAPEEARGRLAEAGAETDRLTYVQADLTEAANAKTLIEAAHDRFGPVHTALCHAGLVSSKPLVDLSAEEWDRTMAVNVKAAFLLGQAAARVMIRDSIAGHLIFTSSWVSYVPWPDIGAYNASKAAMNQLMRSFARELAGKGIRANAIVPGIVNVGMAKRQWDTEPEYRRRARRAIPLGHMQPVESLANAFLFLCSIASSYMTGSLLVVDGGCSLYPMDDPELAD